MEYQGLIFAVGSLIFAPGLAAMLWGSFKSKKRTVPLASSLPTATVLWVFVMTYLTMGDSFLYAAITTTATAVMWTLLMINWERKKKC